MENKNTAKVTVGQKVRCNGYDGTITEVCTGTLEGMVVVRLPGGETCVGISDLCPVNKKLGDTVSGYMRDLGGERVFFEGVIKSFDASGVIINFTALISLPGFGRQDDGVWFSFSSDEYAALKVIKAGKELTDADVGTVEGTSLYFLR